MCGRHFTAYKQWVSKYIVIDCNTFHNIYQVFKCNPSYQYFIFTYSVENIIYLEKWGGGLTLDTYCQKERFSVIWGEIPLEM